MRPAGRPGLAGPPRTLVVTGAPGAGSTTVAAALARGLCLRGLKTLLLSSRPDLPALAEPLAAAERTWPTELEPGLYAAVLERAEPGAHVRAHVRDILGGLGLDGDPDDALRWAPLRDLMVLVQLREHLLDGRWDVVVADLGPLERTVELLGTPDLVLAQLERSLPVSRRVQRALRAGADGEADPVLNRLPSLESELRDLGELLARAEVSTVAVCTPDAAGERARRRGLTALSVVGHPPVAVVVNRLLPGVEPGAERRGASGHSAAGRDDDVVRDDAVDDDVAGDDAAGADAHALHAWGRRAAAAQRRALDSAQAGLAGVRLLTLADLGDEPATLDALDPLRDALASGDLVDPLARGYRVQREGAGYHLVLPLPHVSRDELTLTRVGDDLVLEAAGVRHGLRLPSALRRCRVSGARLRDGQLRVQLVPDPALWRSDV